MDLNRYQAEAIATRQLPAKTDEQDPIISILGLSGEAGELVSEYKKYLRDGDSHKLFKGRVREELGDMLWYIASVADEFHLSLEDVAVSNLAKCQERFGSSTSLFSQFDEGFPEHERFPRKLQVAIISIVEEGATKLRMLHDDGSPLGNDLTDNAYEEDGYRFHDLFHLTCMATLGWSPVLRKLLNCKRRSNPIVNEVEDGGRATAIEEGISALVFSYASDHNHLAGIKQVDYELLRTIKGMTRHIEVQACSARDWERTLLSTYRLWRQVTQQPQGTIILNLDKRSIYLKG